MQYNAFLFLTSLCMCTHRYSAFQFLNYNIFMCISSYNAGGSGAWDSSSCRVLNETAEEVECGCDHLTHFAILLVSD